MNLNLFEHKWEQLSSRQRLSPFPNYNSMESVCKLMPETFGFGYSNVVMTFEENLAKYYTVEGEKEKLGEKAFAMVGKDPDLIQNLTKQVEEISEPFIQKLKDLENEDLSSKISAEIAGYFNYYDEAYKELYHRYFFILLLEGRLTAELKKIIGKSNLSETDAEEIFGTLTTEPRAMVNFREEKTRYEKATLIKKNVEWQRLIRASESIVDLEKDAPELFGVISSHQKEFFWITRDYEDPILDVNAMYNKFREVLSDQAKFLDLEKKISKLKNHENEIKAAEDKLGLNAEEAAMFQLMRDGIFLKERRKEYVSKSLYYFDPVLAETAKRGKSSIKLVRFLAMTEVVDFLAGKIANVDLEERYHLSAWIISKDAPTVIKIDAEAEKIASHMISGIDQSELKGMPISAGKVIGTAKIMMNPEDGYKIAEGDIIVTVQAVPSFSPAISRAAGIVADGGTGLTSHTATLAREAKIPGVTSLKIATQVIKDGDRIEVDGTNGIVKILK